ncbi:CREB-binding protein-like, partial [Thrips palmi]|uniref:CREB-binding protein-like n=1 Tax=Thrips palmi TaxID=161013 RepID=A0A6P8Z6M8_THRPL
GRYRASPRALNASPAITSRAHAGKEQHAKASAAGAAGPAGENESGAPGKAPPVQTIRNYSKVNDDGSFTFGYEAADGSFKEETRGTDCVVRGKYGYVDPDGNKREFTYVSGNPCDPNAVQEEEPLAGAKDAEADSGEENIPANFPSRSLRPTLSARPARPATTLFQQSYNQDSEEDIDDDDLPPAPVPTRARVVRPTPRPTTPQYQSPTTPAPTHAVRITPRPYSSTTAEPPATTYRPQAQQQVSVTPRPTPLKAYSAAPIRSSTPGTIDFSEELRKFQLDNNVVASTERPGTGIKSSDPIYSTELVFDPQSGQYNTVVYQSLPKSQPQDINAVQRHRLQPYVAQQQLAPQQLPHPQLLQQQPQPGSLYQQQLVQQQQQTLLQQSQQLFAQQQRQLQHQRSLQASAASAYQAPRYQPAQLQQVSSTAAPVRLAPAPARYPAQPVQYAAAPGHSSAPQTQFYYVSPQDAGDQRAALAAGQIDAFLRGHNLSF